ncbi:DUF2851 family protein [Christiangramia sabulilitoris]|uniref:DUF2851 family protein n=1 Tax=Christiangramia sabulilitoris TaxID=2583991 RepID=A0A550I395_9FLAO|nr:DUF2851 family protein [Christiangramia sabulilitoris]TRO65419.1 DUF2851 family protein [Christiangramia sabulilitoris]
MKEDFLYHVWKFQKFDTVDIETSEGECIHIIHPGSQNYLSGPDFFNAQIQIGEHLWAGNVEMHLRSSDWYFHRHEADPNYDNVILHVVWDHDVEIYRQDNSVIPTLVLNSRVDAEILQAYEKLLLKQHTKLNCENDFSNFPEFQVTHWLERLYFERLEAKSAQIPELLKETGNDWEAVLYFMLFRSFGLKVNSDSFLSLARNLDFKIVQKTSTCFSLEALFLGQAGLIKFGDLYGEKLQEEYSYLKHKYRLENDHLEKPKFFRLRPDNFPTIRLAQLAALYSENKSLFQDLMQANTAEELKRILSVNISEYWQTHYNFGKNHAARAKNLTSDFIDLLLINCIIPLKHCYSRFIGDRYAAATMNLITGIKNEKNSVIQVFNELRPGLAKNAMDSQALLQLKNNYCSLNKCLHCELGASLLKKSPKYI